MKKHKYFVPICLGLITSLAICVFINYNSQPKVEVNNDSVLFSVDSKYRSDRDLIDKSDTVVEARVKSQSEIFEHKGVDFITSEVEVTNNINGTVLKGDNLKILQTVGDSEDVSILKKDKDYLLFLEKYTGPVTNEAYVVAGMTLGKLDIDGKSIILNDKQKENFKILDNKNIIDKERFIHEIENNKK